MPMNRHDELALHPGNRAKTGLCNLALNLHMPGHPAAFPASVAGSVSCERAVGRWTSCSVAVLIRNAPDLFFDSVRASYSLWKRSPPPLSNSRRLRRRLMRGAPRGVWSATGFANTVHRFRRWFTTAVRESYCCRCPVCQHRRGVQRNPHETITCDRKNGTGGK